MENTEILKVTAPGVTPVAAKKKSRSLINQRQAQALMKAENVAVTGQTVGKLAPLAVRDITADYLAGLIADVAITREKVAEAVASTTARKNATATENQAATSLLAGLHEVQKAAKQKYARTNRIALGDYFVGKHLNGSRPNLLQTSQAIMDRLTTDTLPGITTAKTKGLKAARQTWANTRNEQAAHSTAAQTSRAEIKTMLKSIEDRRTAIQLAADAEWPHTDATNAGIRKEFGLLPRRPLKA